ncbi:Dps family protein [Aquella oligotrophica]|uniref:DNA starvation/stationary phase protection protein n=1 Tax=Aquella oligotrophica TaxID=2067065 RepID=A0A2I7N2X4_9NEIS|nr:Dps family protein [Aquella oligotrophica]AUR50799.1 DNA starvation/stationary phase protection protein [Aquella oligotrophica]
MLKQQFFEINDGITQEHRVTIANGLAALLADSYSLYLKTHNFHWNVTGPMFNTLHLMFETHYSELALAVDLIAERIRALGFIAPGSYSEFAKLSKVTEHSGDTDATDMVKYLIEAHEVVIKTAREIIAIADEANDQVTLDLLTQRLQVHEKTVWMLRSLLR